jgi:hypothetical protein
MIGSDRDNLDLRKYVPFDIDKKDVPYLFRIFIPLR